MKERKRYCFQTQMKERKRYCFQTQEKFEHRYTFKPYHPPVPRPLPPPQEAAKNRDLEKERQNNGVQPLTTKRKTNHMTMMTLLLANTSQ